MISARVEPVPGRPELRTGWRGLLDFGERWTASDSEHWLAEWGPMPIGSPLTHGCQLTWDESGPPAATLTLWAVDSRTRVMKTGAAFTLLDGGTPRASGHLVAEHRRRGELVTGVVTEHRHFGVFIDIGDEEPAVAVITMLDDEPKTPPTRPDIGTTVEGVFLGYAGPGHQPRISLRPGDIRDAQSQR
jgi:hypothetical protein